MSQPLTATHRPQRFDQVAGQDTVKRILSRAAAEDKIAPAYLFSGTRGVGKTTLARVLAKAINCVEAPTAEPCNQCAHCRQITAGAAVDVVEIDGASNRGIEDARRLKEDIGYAPIDCRYKVFIIDEAHMLTREAFNALLKTLEEPPGNATFILATTEPHKFPATIISRCQHYVFKRLSQAELEAHLTAILKAENQTFEEGAVKLLARRAAGSVRDGMSLMGQVLALGGETLTEADVRQVLGLAGQEVFLGLLEKIRDADAPGIAAVLREVLDQGLDLGFFLRELAAMWRTLFLLRQSGERALAVVDLPDTEARQWLEWAPSFSLAHIHAAWQMTLEGQRKVLTSLEPALALELMLLNLAFLPRLLPLEKAVPSPATPSGKPGGDWEAPPVSPRGAANASPPTPQPTEPPRAQPDAPPVPSLETPVGEDHGQAPSSETSQEPGRETAHEPQAEAAEPPPGPRDWDGFVAWAATKEPESFLKGVDGTYDEGYLVLKPANGFVQEKLGGRLARVEELARAFFGPNATVEMEDAPKTMSHGELKKKVKENPLVARMQEELGAQVLDVQTKDPSK